VYETLITEGSGNGSVVEPRPPLRTPPGAGSVLTWCLTIAAVFSTAAVALEMLGFSQVKVTTRIVQFSLLTQYPAALVVAAAAALSLTDAASGAGALLRRASRWAEGALSLCAAAVVAAGVYTIAALLTGDAVGAGDLAGLDWPSRIGYLGLPVADAVLGAVALYVIARSRRVPTRAPGGGDDGTADADAAAAHSSAPRLLEPVVACLLVAMVVLVAAAMTAAFSQGRSIGVGSGFSGGGFSSSNPSVVNRIRSLTDGFNALPIALVALAVVVLIATRRQRLPRDGFRETSGTVAAAVGFLAVVAGGYGAWLAATADVVAFGPSEWSFRAGAIGTSMAAGALGAAAVYGTAHRTRFEPVESAVTRTRFDASVVGLGLAIAALGSAGFVVTPVLVNKPLSYSIGDLLVVYDRFILTTVGLAVAAVVVMTSSRRESTDPAGRDAKRNAVDVIAAVIALATLVATAFVIVYVLVHNESDRGSSFSGRVSVVEYANTAQKVGYVAVALAYGLIAAGALRLIWSARRRPVDGEHEDEVPVVELVP
jgi:hypothetical protein